MDYTSANLGKSGDDVVAAEQVNDTYEWEFFRFINTQVCSGVSLTCSRSTGGHLRVVVGVIGAGKCTLALALNIYSSSRSLLFSWAFR